jgi:anthranilate synthase component I
MIEEMQTEILVEEIAGDTLTPISIYQRLTGKKRFLLESAYKQQDSGRFSFIGSNPIFEMISNNQNVEILYRDGRRITFAGNPLSKIKEILPLREKMEGFDFPFIGGGVGYLGYDVIRHFEDIGIAKEDDIGMPDIHLMFFDTYIVFDHLKQKVLVVGCPLTKETSLKDLQIGMEKLIKELTTESHLVESDTIVFAPFSLIETKKDFLNKVLKAKQHIQKGDIFQVVLSQRMSAQFEGNPFELYRKIRIENQSPYMYFIDFGNSCVAGTSPESLIKVTSETVITNPIAGTKPRGNNETSDKENEKALRNDEKEIAEHKMLVDLGRNDLGRVCDFGSIRLGKFMEIERYQHVMHLVSEVRGRLRKPFTSLDALIACLPAGTVSGAPKIRAMQIINELETSKRGVYSGAVGYLSANGNIDFALAIRTMVMKDGVAYIQAGAGIVYDSVPDNEYDETINKMKCFLEVQKDDNSH